MTLTGHSSGEGSTPFRVVSASRVKRIVGYVVVALVLAVMGRTLFVNWQILQEYSWQLSYPLLAVAVLAALMTQSLYVMMWQTIVRRLGGQITYRQAFRTWFLANLGRYIPGKIWQFVGWLYFGEQAGLSSVQTLTSVAVNLGLQTLTGLALSVIVLAPQLGGDLLTRFWPLLLMIPPGILFAVRPNILEFLLNWGLVRLKREPVELELRTADMFLFTLGHVGLWAAYGVAFYLFVCSLHPVPIQFLPVLGATYAAAWVIGFLSFLTPGGIGVREGVLAYLLGFWLPMPVAIGISLLSRVWVTTAELIGATIAWRLGPSIRPSVSVAPVVRS
jgi:glycosyltransferase 2 family protein